MITLVALVSYGLATISGWFEEQAQQPTGETRRGERL
jgi:hypothetical protein